jgi:hypothetical protein
MGIKVIVELQARQAGRAQESARIRKRSTELGIIGRRLYRPQGLESCLLRFRQPGRAGDVHALVGSLGLEGFETLAGLDIPEFNGCIRTATGQKAAIGTESH